MTETSRRGFIGSLIAFTAAAPAVVRAASLMPVKAPPIVPILPLPNLDQYTPGELYAELAELTRRSFMPRLYVQLWKGHSPLASVFDNQVSA
jgi:hypothetical protein